MRGDHAAERQDKLARMHARRGYGPDKVAVRILRGLADRRLAPSGGRATARAIRDAHLLLLAGMGHDLPRNLRPLITNTIVRNAERSEPAPFAT